MKKPMEEMKHILYNGEKFYQIPDISKFLSLDVETIKETYKVQYNGVMYWTTIEKMVAEGLFNEQDVEKAREDMSKIPLDHMLFTQEFLEQALLERMKEQEFADFKRKIEVDYLEVITNYFGLNEA